MSHVMTDSSNRFRNFAARLLEHEGALVEPVEPQGLEAMLPENLRRAIGAPEFLRLGFAAELPAGAERASLESDWLEKFGRLLDEHGRRLKFAASAAVPPLGHVERMVEELSDVLSFHNYAKPDDFEKHVVFLQQFRRPILCTEYMARGAGSTFQGILPIAKKYKVAAINWGLVAGKTQTYYPWDSWQHPYVDHQPPVWHHEVFHTDGKPYSEEEVAFIRQMTGR